MNDAIHPVLIRIPFLSDLTGPQRVERQRAFARMALDHAARLCGAPAGPWPQTPERVPIPQEGFFWSIAHKPRFAAAVIARAPVGIDIESIAPRTRDLSTAVASPEEWALLKQSRDQQQSRDREGADGVEVQSSKFKVQRERQQGNEATRQGERSRLDSSAECLAVDWSVFFRMWTAKEATLKANSTGIGGLKACRLLRVDQTGRFILSYEGHNFAVEHLSYAGHVAACSCADSQLLWHMIEGPTGP
jgi:phosphopantetheinyl transferase